jgi:hypothetical protein
MRNMSTKEETHQSRPLHTEYDARTNLWLPTTPPPPLIHKTLHPYLPLGNIESSRWRDNITHSKIGKANVTIPQFLHYARELARCQMALVYTFALTTLVRPFLKMSAVVFGLRMRSIHAVKRFGLYFELRVLWAMCRRSSRVCMFIVDTILCIVKLVSVGRGPLSLGLGRRASCHSWTRFGSGSPASLVLRGIVMILLCFFVQLVQMYMKGPRSKNSFVCLLVGTGSDILDSKDKGKKESRKYKEYVITWKRIRLQDKDTGHVNRFHFEPIQSLNGRSS